MELIFNIYKQVMTRTDSLVIASHSRKVHSCGFTFSEEWQGMTKSATFKKNHITYDVLLDNDTCTIPSEVLRSAGAFEVGVYGSDGQRTITSNLVLVEVVAGSPTEGVESRITPSLFEQIMKKIDEVKKGEVEPELILEAVNDYLTEHPLDDIVVDEVATYVAEHTSELKGEKGDTGAIGKSAYQIAIDNGYSGTEQEWLALLKGEKGDTGAKGDTGETPTITMAASVDTTSGTPNVEVSKTGTPTQPKFDFNFSGLKGSNGTNGVNGKSAYQIAIDNGFVGTEEQWIASLKGAKGDKGDAGATYDDTEIKQDIADIWKVQGELGAKNLLKYPYYGTPLSYEGIEFTDSNGVVTINGYPSRAAYYNLRKQETIYLKKGKYIVSVSTPLGNGIHFQVIYNDGSGEKSLASITRDILSQEFTLTDDIISNATYWVVRIAVLANTQVDNLVIKPMIRLASDADDTWQPYAPTNYQLNQKVDTIAGVYLPNATNTNSKKVVASIGQTSVTFDANSFMTRYNVTASDLDLDISAETVSGDVVAYNNVSVTGGIVTVTFDALAEQTTFICKCSVIQ